MNKKISSTFGILVILIIAGFFGWVFLMGNKSVDMAQKETEIVEDNNQETQKIDIEEIDNSKWIEYVKKDEYKISFPNSLFVSYDGPEHVQIIESISDIHDVNEIVISIDKKILNSKSIFDFPDFKSFDDYKKYLINNDISGKEKAIDPMGSLGSVSIFQNTTRSMGGPFVTFTIYDNENIYYEVIVSNPGFLENRELIENIVKTFIVLSE